MLETPFVAHAVDQHASTMPPPEPAKRCGCGRLHSEADWDRLPYVGLQPDGEGGFFALRNCPCGSTLAKEAWVGLVEHLRDEGDDELAHERAERESRYAERGW